MPLPPSSFRSNAEILIHIISPGVKQYQVNSGIGRSKQQIKNHYWCENGIVRNMCMTYCCRCTNKIPQCLPVSICCTWKIHGVCCQKYWRAKNVLISTSLSVHGINKYYLETSWMKLEGSIDHFDPHWHGMCGSTLSCKRSHEKFLNHMCMHP